jgi:hypothetical protein
MATGRRGPVDWSELRERANEFYEYAFLPPSYTNDDFAAGTVTEADVEADPEEFGGFVFSEWLESEELDVGTPTPSAPEPTAEAAYREFEFIEWLESGDSGFEPISISEDPTEPVEPTTPRPTTGSRLGIEPHPAKAATYALFLAVLTLAVLSVVGYAPILGPATGLGG